MCHLTSNKVVKIVQSMEFIRRTFSVADYFVFAIMLAISTSIGFYYAVKDRKKQNMSKLLFGGRSMSPYPVALSLAVSFMSAVTLLGTPAEVYRFGTMYIWYIMVFSIVGIITAEIFIPTFYKMGLNSVYEYLEHRFNRRVRQAATTVYMVQTVLYVGIVIYAPALALNAATGFDLWGAVLSTGSICIIYSFLGGLKAVIWTDVVQACFMLVGLIAILIKGCLMLGGIGTVWSRCQEGGRIDFWRFDLDPRVRHSVWSLNIGGTFMVLSLWGVNQAQVQRYLSCRSVKDAKKSMFVSWVGLVFLNVFAILCGLVMYAYYKGCDPVSVNIVKSYDQLIAYMVLDIFQNNPGMPGIFLASVYAGSLSTVSTGITALASVTVEDFLKPYFKWSEPTYFWISRGLIVFYGALCIFFAYLTSQLGAILQAAISILGLVGGPLLGLFSLGMLFPCANSIGAFGGLLAGLIVNTWVFIGSKSYPKSPQFLRQLSYDTSSCSFLHNSSSLAISTTSAYVASSTAPSTSTALLGGDSRPAVADLYNISYLYYSVLGFSFTVVVGLLLSFASCGHKKRKEVDPKLLYPIFDHAIFFWLPVGVKKFCWCGVDRRKKYSGNTNTKPLMSSTENHKTSRIDTKVSVNPDGDFLNEKVVSDEV